MGRTNPTTRNALRQTEADWQSFRRALRQRDKPHFDTLWEQAAAHADAAGIHSTARPLDYVLISVALEQERRLAELEARVDEAPDD